MQPRRLRRILEKLTLRWRLAAAVFTQFDDDFRRTGLQVSFAQRGEDVLAMSILRQLGILRPSYVDVGANHPTKLSNTYLMYLLGCRGISIEPDPDAAALIIAKRPRDITINAGVARQDGEMEFFVMDTNVANTFNREEAQELERRDGNCIRRVLRVPVRNLQSLLDEYRTCPDFMSVDVEGMDLQILETLDWSRCRPKVLCVETIEYFTQSKRNEISDFLEEKGYVVRADTHINSLFVDSFLKN